MKLVDGGKYSHVGIITNNVVTHATMSKGVIRQPLSQFVSLFPTHEIVSFNTPSPLVGENWLLSQVGKGYDFKGMWKVVFPFLQAGDGDKWYCSELALATMLMSGIEIPLQDTFGVKRLYEMAKALQAVSP